MSPSLANGRKLLPASRVKASDTAYPAGLTASGYAAPLYLIGDPAILGSPAMALFCSKKCPGSIILGTYDAMQRLKMSETIVAGGFHSPMERTCLDILLRGKARLIVCPARGIRRLRPRPEWRMPLAENRLLILSPFDEAIRRSTVQLASARNRFVGALVSSLFIPYAARRSRTEQFAVEMLSQGKTVYTLPDPESQPLIDLGARVLTL